MPEIYSVECDCGRAIRVELFEAGIEKTCPACNATVAVPSATRLKALTGDRYPLLRPLEKVERTAQYGEAPFDGHCHRCGGTDAMYQTPVTIGVLIERHLPGGGGIRPSLIGGFKLTVPEAEELWKATSFPLLLCDQCQMQFEWSRSMARFRNALKFLSLLGLLAAFLLFAWHNAEAIAAAVGLSWLLLVFALFARFQDTRKMDPFLRPWLANIRWIPEALEMEDEYRISVGRTQSFPNRQTIHRP